MKRVLFTLCSIVACVFMAYSQTGTWSGNLEVQGTKLPLVIHFNPEGSTMDSPAQNAKGIPVEVSHDTDGMLIIAIPLIRAEFRGIYTDDKIEGTYSQSGFSLPLTLIPGEVKLNRPQTPTGKGPYSEEEVSFSNGDAVLRGTLTLPDGYDVNTPVVLMVTGSGLQDRDEGIFEHKPFAVIADALARAGIASLRYDDRGFGQSTGDVVNCTTNDLMLDALSGVNLLKKRFNKVGVLGHSEGGTIALMLAADKSADFIVSLAGMVVSGKETLIEQNRYMLATSGVAEKTVDDYCNLISMIFDNDDSYAKKMDESDIPDNLKKNLEAVAFQSKSPYMQYFVTLDIRDRLGNISCPVLALNGTKDTQVFFKENIEALKNGVPVNNSNKFIAVDGVNHLFQHCNTGSTMEYRDIEETISPGVLEIITDWINNSARSM